MKKNIYLCVVLLIEFFFMIGIISLLIGLVINDLSLIVLWLINIILNGYNLVRFTYLLDCEDLKGSK